jgi:hypothetical protein
MINRLNHLLDGAKLFLEDLQALLSNLMLSQITRGNTKLL